MRKRINLLREFSVPLIAGVVVAVLWANLDPAGYAYFDHNHFFGPFSFHFVTNELFMVFFFGIAAVEITQSCLPGGDLNPPRKAINPLLATLGGVLGPVAVYFLLNGLFGAPTFTSGWGIPTATDIALAWLAARLVFGDGHPAISFLLLLAIADDAIGLAIIAIFYPDPSVPAEPLWLLLTVAGMGVAWILRNAKVKSYWPYLLLAGVPSWFGLHEAHLHPALALVFIVPFFPHLSRETKHLFEADPRDRSTLSRFEHDWKIIVDFGLFMFGLANAGVQFSGVGTATWLVFLSLLAGKALGIFSFGFVGKKLGFPLPDGMGKRELMVAGVIAGIGFTVALFVAGE
ncbi:MAG TPA: Na+/H+ antiporter NhaA, partial [Geobacteraceae bacterium]|nr:Na+/H+ antiporter NhaA [Geobacteraceae bacterium]